MDLLNPRFNNALCHRVCGAVTRVIRLFPVNCLHAVKASGRQIVIYGLRVNVCECVYAVYVRMFSRCV